VVPIDADPDSSVALTSESREAKITGELLTLSDNAKGKPVVAWVGNGHAAKSVKGGVPCLAKRIAESPQFANGNRRLSTVLSQLSEVEELPLPLAVLAKNVREPVGVPTTSKDGQETDIGSLPLMDKAYAKYTQTDIKVSDYDHVVFYPPASPEERLSYNNQRLFALMADVRTGAMDSQRPSDDDPLAEERSNLLKMNRLSESTRWRLYSRKEQAVQAARLARPS
jgi:hypothetical protein